MDGSSRAARILVASNRGPVAFSVGEDGELRSRRGGGGVVSGLSAIDSAGESLWVCAALTDGDREAVRRGVAEPGSRMISVEPDVFHAAYNDIANSVLWFVHHMLYQTPLEPAFDQDFREQWAAYESYNAAFADALAEEAAPQASVLVQDYHLALVPALLRERRPDLRIGHFSHTPWAPPDYFRLLPDDIAAALLEGILGSDRAAFLTRRWAAAFAACCADVLGATVSPDGHEVTHRGRTTRLGVHGLGADADFLRERAHRPDVAEQMAALRAEAGPGRRLIVRVDRTELSKNIVRGLYAYRRLLTDRPGWRSRVVHVAFAYPSRQDLAVYREYTEEVGRVADAINAEFGTPDWQPVLLKVDDDFPRSLAAYRLADVALVNPIRDGMNLVAKEMPVVSDNGVALVLSREAGAYAELGDDAIVVNPYDVTATAEALNDALTLPDAERADRTKRLAAAATALPPTQWFLDQVSALEV
ncbi:trehalose-6-phosphate synthase [Streptomyces cocklensis]|jgi:trehalose 6-phosphate synthase|uniref:Alpha,alpha-trehalose-phosphate synthase (UDP-forming) n=1 Tax=Actinacidiphila cocklensis TaxID=887465 RepID=A0A9W4GQW6_9ACTN|nr:trehalose-6-phosphate synthase [Actinacidiphila cocklensis]MDD1057561.1 trehalose-6-phosphate synthase [Actinacidiphila cocklensis]CAG6393812.1 Alpha,alpha-trehalose-phosphate synthase (UDP-forming) [Actinacidiphila cocklensis]